MAQNKIWTYENGLLLLLGGPLVIAIFDRNAASILVPFIEHDLHLDNTQVGFIGSGLSITWALGAYLISRWSDASGVRKPFLLAFLFIFSACPFLSVCLAIMAAESSPHRRGINAGIMQNFFASVLGQSLAPLLLVPLAIYLGWRSAFYLAGVPGLLCAVAVWLWVREPDRAVQSAADTSAADARSEHL